MEGFETLLVITIWVIGVIVVVLALVAAIMSIWLAIKYIKYNKRMTQAGIAGKDIARTLLDKNGLQNIKVKKANIFTAFMVGNSYSHYFKRVRLRGLIYSKASITSVAISGQKVGLALLDKEGDPDMKKRIRLLPLLTFGPFAFVLLVAVGIVIDILASLGGILAVICCSVGIVFYIFTFVLSLTTLKTETKAQDRALEMLQADGYLQGDEVDDAKELYRLYIINYKLNMIIELLEMIMQILKLILNILKYTNNSSSKSSN